MGGEQKQRRRQGRRQRRRRLKSEYDAGARQRGVACAPSWESPLRCQRRPDDLPVGREAVQAAHDADQPHRLLHGTQRLQHPPRLSQLMPELGRGSEPGLSTWLALHRQPRPDDPRVGCEGERRRESLSWPRVTGSRSDTTRTRSWQSCRGICSD
eukprot:416187-Hanusia_phi.AAC.4